MGCAIVQCSSLKQSTPGPAYWLYSRSPRFAQAYLSARKIGKVYILSAKYGVIEPDKIIQPYDLKIDVIDREMIKNIKAQVSDALRQYGKIIAYVSDAYKIVFENLSNIDFIDGALFDRAKKIGKQGSMSIKDEPMACVIEHIYRKKVCHVREVKLVLREAKYSEATVSAQCNRLKNSPVLLLAGDFVKYRYLENYE